MAADTQTVFSETDESLGGSSVPACVVQIHGGSLGRRIELQADATTFGRVEGNDVIVQLSTVSRQHARVFYREGSWWVEDRDSTNGTFLNSIEILAATKLHSSDHIKIGQAIFKFLESGDIESLYHEAIHRMMISDGLTGAANKRHFSEFFEREMIRAGRHDRPLSLVIFDLDHFKKVNDTFGHLAGDQVLREVAARISGRVRGDELFARYGGEEFAVVLPETTLEAASIAAEGYRQLIESEPVCFDDRDIDVSASIGVASRWADDDQESLIARADACLYKAKDRGRNMVVAENSEDVTGT